MKKHAPHLVVHVLLLVALVVVLVTAPLGALSLLDQSHQAKAPAASVRVTSGHVCDKNDYVTGCALPQAPLAEIVRGVDPVLQGVDFGWSCPVSAAKNFGASYISYDTSKNWSRSCVDAFHAAHKATVAVWEAGANDAQGGYALGHSQALTASSQLQALGAGPHQPILMAIDCDCAGSSLVDYFRGANAAEPGRIDAYGGYDQIAYLYAQHLVGHANWQTYAWSGGRWLPASVAPLEQYLNSSSVDYDRAIAAYYGQWPYNAPKPQPKVVCFGKHRQHSSLCDKVRGQAANLGQRRNREQGYLKVSERNAVKVQTALAPLQRRLAQIDGRAALELRKNLFGALEVSAHNAAKVDAQVEPLGLRLSVVESRIKLEQAKALAFNQQLERLLGQYGYHG